MSRAESLDSTTREPAIPIRSVVLAALLFAFVSCVFYEPIWSAGVSVAIPSTSEQGPIQTRREAFSRAIAESDALFTAWVVGRNAYTLLHDPLRLHHGERCHPTRLSMALGNPVLALSVLAVPAYAISADPIAAYNAALVAATFAAAMAMFLLVTRWTGEPAAGLVAGLLYAFSYVKLADALHPNIHDTAWTLFGLYFAREWFAMGRLRDALGLVASCAMQISASFYPFLGATALAVPMLGWLCWRNGFSKTRPWHVALIVAGVGGAALFVFGPYLEIGETSQLIQPPSWGRTFGNWTALIPGGRYFMGWFAVTGFAAAVLAPSRAGSIGDPRVPLLLGGVLVMWLATGDFLGLPNLYLTLARVLPGLGKVRIVASLMSVAFLVAIVLSGLGFGAALRRIPAANRRWAAFALVTLATAYTLSPYTLPLDQKVSFRPRIARPSLDEIRFFEQLENLGNSGPILETPMSRRDLMREANSLMLSAYHHRATSVCGTQSFYTAKSLEIDELGARLPDPAAATELIENGFSTVIVHH
ncbi:MAG: hypothetical protein VCE43_15785, partial [Myxococcota bacterium]